MICRQMLQESSSKTLCLDKGTPKTRYNSGKIKLKGLYNEYFNLMWDPHVFRGKTFISGEEKRAREVIKCQKNAKYIGVPRLHKTERFKEGCCPIKPVHQGQGDSNLPLRRKSSGQSLLEELLPDYRKYLEEEGEGDDKVIIFQEKETQTDDWLPEGEYQSGHVLAREGKDASTQMEDDKCDLEGLTEEMTRKIADQAMLELIQEEEMAIIRRKKNQLTDELIRHHDDLSKLEVAEQCMMAQKERLAAILEDQLEEEEDVAEAINARFFSKAFLRNIGQSTVELLQSEGFFTDGFVDGVKDAFNPKINSGVREEMADHQIATTLLDDVMSNVVIKKGMDFGIIKGSEGVSRESSNDSNDTNSLNVQFSA